MGSSSFVFPAPMFGSFVGEDPNPFYGPDHESALDELQWDAETQGVGSVGFVFSLWNTMVGSTILVLPYGFAECGPVGGAVVAATTAGLSLFTALGVAETGRRYPDFCFACHDSLGPWAQHLCTLASLTVWSGVFVVYQIMMNDSLVNIVQLFYPDFTVTFGAILIAVLLFPVCALRDFSILVRINALGVMSVIFLLFFIIFKSASRYSNGEAPDVVDTLTNSSFSLPGLGTLCGMLAAGYFSHNALHPLMQVKKDQTTIVRDCSIAYGLVFLSYSIAGFLPAVAFANSPDLKKTENFLLLKDFENEPLTVAAQASLLLQLCTVWPLILGLCRSAIFEKIYKTPWPSTMHVLALNTAYMAFATFGTIELHSVVGKVLSYVAAVSGFVYMYMLPFFMTLVKGLQNTPEARATTAQQHNSEQLAYEALYGEGAKDEPLAEPEPVSGAWVVLTGMICLVGAGSLVLPFV